MTALAEILRGDTENAVVGFDESDHLTSAAYPTSNFDEAAIAAHVRFGVGQQMYFKVTGWPPHHEEPRHCEIERVDHPEEGWTRLHLHEC